MLRHARVIFLRWARSISVEALLTATLLSVTGGAVAQGATGGGLQPLVEKARGGQCVEEPAFMRRNHMKLLKHQRDDTMHGGDRTGKYSLKACVACHASQTTQSVSAQQGNFCQSCHAYAAVKIDCFECHANKPASKQISVAVSQTPVAGQVPGVSQMLVQQQVKP